MGIPERSGFSRRNVCWSLTEKVLSSDKLQVRDLRASMNEDAMTAAVLSTQGFPWLGDEGETIETSEERVGRRVCVGEQTEGVLGHDTKMVV